MPTTAEQLRELSASAEDRERLLEVAIDQHGSYFLWYFESLCGDAHLAEDLFQQLWIHVHQKFPLAKYDQFGLLRFKAYQLYVDDARKRGVRSFVQPTDELPERLSESITTEAATEEEEKAFKQKFWSQFEKVDLSENQREAFWMAERQGYTVKEIAEHMKKPTSTVHDWIKSVKTKCAAYLNEETQK